MLTSWLLVVFGITTIAYVVRRSRRNKPGAAEPFAVVEQVWWSGISLGTRTVVGLRLSVHVPGGKGFRAQATLRVAQGREGWIFPGARVEVRLPSGRQRELELLPPIPLGSSGRAEILATILSPSGA